jgi:hypothetical protein
VGKVRVLALNMRGSGGLYAPKVSMTLMVPAKLGQKYTLEPTAAADQYLDRV